MAVLLLLVSGMVAQGGAAAKGQAQGQAEGQQLAEGILQSIGNAAVERAGDRLVLQRVDSRKPMRVVCAGCEGFGLARETGQWWVLPTGLAAGPVRANAGMWLLPLEAASTEHAWRMEFDGAEATTSKTSDGLMVELPVDRVVLTRWEARPHADPFGRRFRLRMEGGAAMEEALAAFYWGTMLPSIVEKTMAAQFRYSSGYVLSTLQVASYAGSYPAVDHEFQIRGRLAMGTELDLDVARRMVELQFRLMNDDPEGLSRSPTSVQPDGRREYHIRRDSKDARENAAMFPLTANIEVVEESWRLYEAQKNREWLAHNIGNLERAAGWTMASVDPYGRVWGDVYYEDQVIKDGRETEVEAFAAHSFALLATMEEALGREDKSREYATVSRKIAAALVAPLPMGYWDAERQRFVDWVDRNSRVHDHVALLGNTLPVTLGYATEAQATAVKRLMAANEGEFERFPSFVAADIAAYTASEMGVAGPYDLSAAGRYWYWDARYREREGQNEVLLRQLLAVAAEGKKSGYLMGERYDMDHVYYVDGKDAHGAEKYYEYPNVFAAVLVGQYLGLSVPADADVAVRPHLQGAGDVEFDTTAYALGYAWDGKQFRLRNLADRPRRFAVDLSGVGPAEARYGVTGIAGVGIAGARVTVVVPAGGEAVWALRR